MQLVRLANDGRLVSDAVSTICVSGWVIHTLRKLPTAAANQSVAGPPFERLIRSKFRIERMKFEIDRMKFVLANEKFDRGVAELFRRGNKFDRDGMKFGVECLEFLIEGRSFIGRDSALLQKSAKPTNESSQSRYIGTG